DGAAWTIAGGIDALGGNALYGVVPDGSSFVVVGGGFGYGENLIGRSADFASWTTTPTSLFRLNAILSFGSKLYAFSGQHCDEVIGCTPASNVVLSLTAGTWTEELSQAGANITSIAYGGGEYAALDDSCE